MGGVNFVWVKRFGDGPSILYMCFFMPAFFFITGYVSNFNKSYRDFFSSNIKGLIVPYISFTIVTTILRKLFYSGLTSWTFAFLESFWFLTALFIAKFIYFFLIKAKLRNLEILIVLVALSLISIALNTLFGEDGLMNLFHYRNALCLGIFIWLGGLYKRNETKLKQLWKVMAITYFPIIAILKACGIFPPFYTHTTNITFATLPLFILIASCGSVLIAFISKKIVCNNMLEFFGRNSLVVYCMQGVTLGITAKLFSHILMPTSIIQSLIWVVLIYVVTVFILCLVCKLFVFKPFSYLTGKW